MSKNKSRLKNILGTVPTIFISIFLILTFVNVVGAVLDCSMCHKTVPGNAAVRAIDTIEISNKTCLKCHSSEYSPKPIGYDTHLAHVGKYSAKVDYLSRHPKAADSINCDNCHMNIGENCRNCHTRNIPHIEPPLGNSCKGCHGVLDKLFQHPTISLKIHDIFGENGVNGTRACSMCHNQDNMASLKLASKDIVSMQESHGLCFQCHSDYYNLWNSGQHHSNKSMPSDQEIKSSGDIATKDDLKAARDDLENQWRSKNTCVTCHNPHNPSELYQLPTIELRKPGVMSTTTVVLYGIIVLVAVIAIVAGFLIKKKKLVLSDLKLSRIKLFYLKLSKMKLSDIKLPKLKLPKISIPISISVEEDINKADKVDDKVDKPVDNVDKVDEKVDEPVDKVVPKTGKDKFLHKYRYDIAFVSVICIMLSTFYIMFGAFVPLAIVASESMVPHIDKGDVIFYTDISRIDRIGTYDKRDPMSFEDYGDVILYKPFGQEGVTPYVHRAMYYVNLGDEMWPGGPKAPYAGYITKGDNPGTNSRYDQQLDISKGTPIKREWIVGIAKFRIPYIGYIRLLI